MDKILSIQTIKNVFAALGAKTSDSNYGVALLDKTTAEPKGLMGMSDLASVLGEIFFVDDDNTWITGDINTFKKSGFYRFSSSTNGYFPDYHSVLVFGNCSLTIQFDFNPNFNRIAFRCYHNNTGWRVWKEFSFIQ